jgi:ribonuclease BN (tRNA processing enzyme)
MSTFRGIVLEFPEIRSKFCSRLAGSTRLIIFEVDFFRPIFGHRAPRACFLSHVHSDHLAGLENQTFHGNLYAPFPRVGSSLLIRYSLYCSPATREILLRLEKYPARMDFHRGISQAHKATYKHLKDRLV